jgi:uncharacterized membrane-anchored protein
MRKFLVIFAVGFQIALLAGMAGQREFILRTGKTVYLRTRPVDPQDMFRGEYARLDYDISHIDNSFLRDGLTKISDDTDGRKYRRVYAVLNAYDDSPAELLYLTDKKPKEGTFIRGWFQSYYGHNEMANVQYGIEAFFVEQGTSQKLQRPRKQDTALTLEMETALGKNGTAVLKGYRFAPLALGLEPNFVRDPNGLSVRPRQLIKYVTLKLINVSDKPVAIVDLSGGGSFSLEQSSPWYPKDRWQWVNQDVPRKAPQNSDVRVLKPDEIYEVRIDLTNPDWFVTRKDKSAVPISELYWEDWGWGSFRLVYRSPTKEQCAGLDNAEIIWHGYLFSPAFTSNRSVD